MFFDVSETEESLEWDFTDIQAKLTPTPSLTERPSSSRGMEDMVMQVIIVLECLDTLFKFS